MEYCKRAKGKTRGCRSGVVRDFWEPQNTITIGQNDGGFGLLPCSVLAITIPNRARCIRNPLMEAWTVTLTR